MLLHEIESAYEKEWEILKLPGKITGFLLLHIPIVFAFFYGFYAIIQYPQTRAMISIIAGVTGFIPFKGDTQLTTVRFAHRLSMTR